MTISTLEDAVSILEKWLIANAPEKSVVLHLSPKKVQEELGFSPSTFWYALMKIQEQQPDFRQPMYVTVYNHYYIAQQENHE